MLIGIFILLMLAGTAKADAPAIGAPAAGGEDRDSGTIYSPIGKRDPFRAQPLANLDRVLTGLNGLERYSLEQFQLRAVLRGLGKARAMFEDPEGKSYILTEGDSIGREHATISRIVNSEVIVTQRTFNYLGAESLLEKVISLPKDNDLDEGNTKKGAEPQRPGNPVPDAGGAGPGTGAAPGTGTGAGAGAVPGVIGVAGALGGLNLPAAMGALQGAIQQAAPPTDVDLNKAPATPH